MSRPAARKSPSGSSAGGRRSPSGAPRSNGEERKNAGELREAAESATAAFERVGFVGAKRGRSAPDDPATGMSEKAKGKRKASLSRDGGASAGGDGMMISCGVCTEFKHPSEGIKCDAGHFSCSACVEKLLYDSIERSGDGMSAAEHKQLCYHVKCSVMGDATGVCHRIFSWKQLASGVPEKAIDALRDKNLEFAIEKKLPDAAKAFAAETQKSAGTLSLEQEAQSIRSSYRQVNGRFRDESGAVVKQCERCGVGPVEKRACDDMSAHHGDLVRDARTGAIIYKQDMSCRHCNFLDQRSWSSWPDWDGRYVIGLLTAAQTAEVAARLTSAGSAPTPQPARASDNRAHLAERESAPCVPWGGGVRRPGRRAPAAAPEARQAALQRRLEAVQQPVRGGDAERRTGPVPLLAPPAPPPVPMPIRVVGQCPDCTHIYGVYVPYPTVYTMDGRLTRYHYRRLSGGDLRDGPKIEWEGGWNLRDRDGFLWASCHAPASAALPWDAMLLPSRAYVHHASGPLRVLELQPLRPNAAVDPLVTPSAPTRDIAVGDVVRLRPGVEAAYGWPSSRPDTGIVVRRRERAKDVELQFPSLGINSWVVSLEDLCHADAASSAAGPSAAGPSAAASSAAASPAAASSAAAASAAASPAAASPAAAGSAAAADNDQPGRPLPPPGSFAEICLRGASLQHSNVLQSGLLAQRQGNFAPFAREHTGLAVGMRVRPDPNLCLPGEPGPHFGWGTVLLGDVGTIVELYCRKGSATRTTCA